MLLLHIFRGAVRANMKPCLKETFKLLQQLKATQWHSLAGLDDITADDGMNGFSFLEKVVKLYLKGKNLVDLLEKGKNFNNTVPS